ncbi:MAG: FAD-binding oxidoreductase [Gemmatimonadetes bacterium]|nr:FAD-binding oxidoreductase [Gemmatimonadota bacterium]
MSTTLSLDPEIAALVSGFRGQLIEASHVDYDAQRRVHNGLIDRRPLLIARCRGVADIVDAVKLARKGGYEVAVRGGGHNVGGRAVSEGGVVIDLSTMKGIHVDPAARTVRVQAGVTWGELNRETQLHGLAVTGGIISTTGVAGLTLGGGLGWLLGKHGFAVDNLRSVQLVTADGGVLEASAQQNEDLFWGLRGAGSNFGVASSFEFQLHAVGPTVTGGLVAHSFDKARDLLRYYRDVTSTAPDELTMFSGLLHGPDGTTRLAGIVACHCGSLEAGAAALAPIKRFGTPAMDALGPIAYCEMNSMLDAGYPRGALNYWKSSTLRELSDDVIDAMIDAYTRCPSPMSQVLLEHVHGAATRVDASETAFALRNEGYNLLVLGQWLDPAHTDRCISWVKETFERLRPYMAATRYVNYLGDDEQPDQVAAAYGPNHARLRRVKAKYDPANFFHLNQNVTPLA